ncbi:benzoate 4-monooxygenase cytochrome-like protein P450 [Massarina eburnea CBS 473.64]|uniref:Cytochrome P450 monooxygenase ABA1 n=1 Tax=Massarina eburnea CBS 473.64 TaxID=1395130 RepID=A0A6A6S032_9PLEO|nr:benzoate 4-monooxygenase cytochrome-like protein P450 [Massarina eburnea CBS 473.64]
MAVLNLIYSARWLIFGAILSIYTVSKYKTYKRLSQFKGPFSTGWSEIWHIRAIMSYRSHECYREATDKYGSITRVGPNDLVTNSPDLLCHMSAVRSPYTRTPWYSRATRAEPGRDHLFSLTDEETHTKRRQKMASGFSGKENLSLEPSIDSRVHELIHLIRSKYISSTDPTTPSKPMDLAMKAQFFTLDVISHIGFGRAFGDLAADADVDGYIAASEEGMKAMTFICATGLTPIFQSPLIARLFGPSETDKSGHGKMMRTSRRLISDRMDEYNSGKEKGSDMLASFIHRGMTKDEICTEAFLQILAGSDTTATAIRSTMLHLMSHPRVYRRLQEEIDWAVREGVVGEGGVISEANAETLPYLQAVVREGLRIHLPISDVVPKIVPKGGDIVVVDGIPTFLPEGTNVGYDVLGLARRKDLFGDDPDVFRPERWLLEEGSEKLETMRRMTEMIFGYGKYQCLGKPIAWMEINKVIFELLRHFDWAIMRPAKPWKTANYIGIFLQQELWVLVHERGS